MKIIVVGAGASGLMASALLSEKGHDVLLIEKNEKVGRKIYITGKGRCNLTNACSRDEFLKNVVSNPKFLYTTISQFDYQSVMDFFTSRGVELEIQRGNRVFPKSLKSASIIDCLLKANRQAGTKIHFLEEVKEIKHKEQKFEVVTNKDSYVCDKLIIATGGLSYPGTGSTGDGYKFAESCGVNVVECVPALNAIKIKESIPDSLDKFTLKNVRLTLQNGKKVFSQFGDLTFYNYGLAGPISLTLSSYVNRINPNDLEMYLDLKPALTKDQILNRIQNDIKTKKYNDVRQLLLSFLPRELFNWFVYVSGIDTNLSIFDLSKENRTMIINSLKQLKLTYQGIDDIERATVTAGGVNVNEINSSTMECKKVPNIYFIGEVLDLDALTGGFNLQIAFATAMQLASKF